MVPRNALPQGGSFFEDIGIAAGSGTKKSGLQQSAISNAKVADVACYLTLMDGKDFRDGQIIRDSASFLYSGPNFS
jgi:hypothetical protein